MKNHILKLKNLRVKLTNIDYLIKNYLDLNLDLNVTVSLNDSKNEKISFDINGDNYKILKNIRVDTLRTIAKYELMNTDRVIIYTDGSSLPKNPGFMGIGGITIDTNGNETQVTRYVGEGTNNLAELLAVMVSITQLPFGTKVNIITDSMYVWKGINVWMEIWEKNDYTVSNGNSIKNLKYWKAFAKIRNDYDVTADWTKAHQNGEFFNNNADKLAKYAVIDKSNREKEMDIEYVFTTKLGKYFEKLDK